jgi:hypothetical protein
LGLLAEGLGVLGLLLGDVGSSLKLVGLGGGLNRKVSAPFSLLATFTALPAALLALSTVNSSILAPRPSILSNIVLFGVSGACITTCSTDSSEGVGATALSSTFTSNSPAVSLKRALSLGYLSHNSLNNLSASVIFQEDTGKLYFSLLSAYKKLDFVVYL